MSSKNEDSIAKIIAENYENNFKLANAVAAGEISDNVLSEYQMHHAQLAERLKAFGTRYKLGEVEFKELKEVRSLLTELETDAILEARKGFRTLLKEGAKYESNRIAIEQVKRLSSPEKIAEYIKNDTPLIDAHQEALQGQVLQNLRLFQEIIREADEQKVEIQNTKELIELARQIVALEKPIGIEPVDLNSIEAPRTPAGPHSKNLEI
jgi:hypothetical protein